MRQKQDQMKEIISLPMDVKFEQQLSNISIEEQKGNEMNYQILIHFEYQHDNFYQTNDKINDF